ncbi:ATP-binding Cassette (ABC) Superfamily [Thraustotheca clavata]|uniref:ATP-binding Cassette (ABC) Superfamily n=1 Tax=Thraustotheca clavata TaxID=74557 RepID=A0A1W0AB64_9STRA|nr:ATP-binding Cassette (ABC) Superfamily [Thraustotheca clavata]
MLGHQSTKYHTFADPGESLNTHPLDQVSWLSKIWFSWTKRFIKLANTKGLASEDLWPLPRGSEVHSLAANFDTEYYVYKQSILRTFFAVHGRIFILVGCLEFLVAACDLYTPFSLYLILKGGNIVYLGACLVGVQIIKAFASAHGMFYNKVIGIEFSSALRHMLFEKALGVHSSKDSWIDEFDQTNFSSQVLNVSDIALVLHHMWILPLEIAAGMYLIYYIAGQAVFGGIAAFVAFFLLDCFCTTCQCTSWQKELIEYMNHRMYLFQLYLNSMDNIKCRGWESFCDSKIVSIRALEESSLAKFLRCLWVSASTVIVLTIFISHSYFSTEPAKYSIAVVFSVISIVHRLHFILNSIPKVVQSVVKSFRAIKTMHNVLLVEQIDETNVVTMADRNAAKYTRDQTILSVQDGTFQWSTSGPSIFQKMKFKVKRGEFVVIHGGNGKSSLCTVLLGEMYKSAGIVFVGGSVAYVAQTPWVQLHLSIRENILFGKTYDRLKYQKIIDACGLTMDFLTFPIGDRTEPTNAPNAKKVILTKAQEARISLARACYSDADIYLIDSILCEMDMNIASHIFRNCILGILQQKTILLVSNNPQIIECNYVDATICIKDHGVLSIIPNATRGKLPRSPVRRRKTQKDFLSMNLLSCPPSPHIPGRSNFDTKLVLPHESHENVFETCKFTCSHQTSVLPHIYSMVSSHSNLFATSTQEDEIFLPQERHLVKKNADGQNGTWMIVLVTFITISVQIVRIGSDIWLAQCTNGTSSQLPWPLKIDDDLISIPYGAEIDLGIAVYILISLSNCILTAFEIWLLLSLCQRQTFKQFREAISKLLHAPLIILDALPSQRLLSRFRDDSYICDVYLPCVIVPLAISSSWLASTFLIVMVLLQGLGAIIAPVVVMYIREICDYIAPVQDFHRMEQQTRKPLSVLVSACLKGCVTIRAYGNMQLLRFYHLHHQKIEENAKTQYAMAAVNARMNLLLYLLGSMALAVVFFVLWLNATISVSIIGVVVLYAIEVSMYTEGLVDLLAALDLSVKASTRLVDISTIEQEATRQQSTIRFPYGRISFEHVHFALAPNQPAMLKDINFEILGGEKVALLGGQCAGKSCIAMAIFRLYPLTTGRICIDGVDIMTLNEINLRCAITIIPQFPRWLHSSIREYIDPYDAYSDNTIFEALRKLRLASKVAAIGLDNPIKETNGVKIFNTGELQLLSACQALLTQAKIIIIDEADAQIESFLHQTLSQLCTQSTIIAITQHLDHVQTFNRAIILDHGQVLYTGSPDAAQEHLF